MSLYNALFGHNELAPLLLGLLGKTAGDFGRFRDCFVDLEDGAPMIVVYTRCGGGNREDYGEVFEMARQHPLFIRDWDDSFDCTYANLAFRFPAELPADLVAKLMELGKQPKPAERFQNLIAALGKPGAEQTHEVQRALALGQKIAGHVENATGSGVIAVHSDGSVTSKQKG